MGSIKSTKDQSLAAGVSNQGWKEESQGFEATREEEVGEAQIF